VSKRREEKSNREEENKKPSSTLQFPTTLSEKNSREDLQMCTPHDRWEKPTSKTHHRQNSMGKTNEFFPVLAKTDHPGRGGGRGRGRGRGGGQRGGGRGGGGGARGGGG